MIWQKEKKMKHLFPPFQTCSFSYVWMLARTRNLRSMDTTIRINFSYIYLQIHCNILMCIYMYTITSTPIHMITQKQPIIYTQEIWVHICSYCTHFRNSLIKTNVYKQYLPIQWIFLAHQACTCKYTCVVKKRQFHRVR